MKITPININEIPNRSYSRNKIDIFVKEFLDKNIPAAEIQYSPGEYISAVSCCSCYSKAIRRMHVGVKCMTRGDKVYLVRTEALMGGENND